MQTWRSRYTLGGVALFLGMLHLTLGTLSRSGSTSWDLPVGRWVQSWQDPWLDRIFRFLSLLGDGAIPFLVAALVGVLLFRRGWTLELRLFLIGAASSALLNRVFKLWLSRPRPTAGELRILGSSGSPGYPSGHAAFALFLFGFFFLTSLRRPAAGRAMVPLRLFLATAPLAVGLSRIYLGMHWPSDVLGGFLGAALILVVISHFYLRAES